MTRTLHTSHQMERERSCRPWPLPALGGRVGFDGQVFHKVLLSQTIHPPSLTGPFPKCPLPLARGATPLCSCCCVSRPSDAFTFSSDRGHWRSWLRCHRGSDRLSDMPLYAPPTWHLQSPVPPLAGGTARNLCSPPCQQPEGEPEGHDTSFNPEVQSTRGLAYHPLPVPATSQPLY